MMEPRLLEILRCPYTGQPLTQLGDALITPDGNRYPLAGNMPHLLEPERVGDLDLEFQKQYQEKDAQQYDRAIARISLMLGTTEARERRAMTSLLDLRPGYRVLEISVGTGANLPYIARRIGPGGEIVALDLALAMMGVAQSRAKALPVPVHFVRGDGCYLPFADNAFDAVFHFGGVNMFSDLDRALGEMVRVAKPGATVVVGDEGMSERRRSTFLGRQAGSMNKLLLCRPPFGRVPWEEITEFQLHWVWREIFYLFRFRKAIPGERGQSDDVKTQVRRRIAGYA